MTYAITKHDVDLILDYDLDAQVFVWRERPVEMFPSQQAAKAWNAKWAGLPAGTSRNKQGYRQITIFGRTIPVSRLVWLLSRGEWPAEGLLIDHIDRDNTNDRPENLRLASSCQNCRNRSSVGAVPYKGVSFKRGKYEANIMVNGAAKYLGQFEDERDAAMAYNVAAQRNFGEFAVLNEVF